MRLHLVALPHTRVSPDFNGCAYTQKVAKFGRMMGDRHDVFLYAPEGSGGAGFTETVDCLPDQWRTSAFGADDRNRLPAWPDDSEAPNYEPRMNALRFFSTVAAAAIIERAEPGDLVLLSGGRTHLAVFEAVRAAEEDGAPHLICVEPGVGYEGVFTQRCAYESHAWRHFVAGKYGHPTNGHWYDTVIPNYFDPDEFPHVNEGGGDYLLFLGRMNWDKGPHIAAEIATRLGMPLIAAGAGVWEVAPGRVSGNGVVLTGDVEWYGPVTVEERAELLAGAAALLAPTLYMEPFGGVAVEAMMAGTPAVTTNIGAFPETVQEGVSGFRFNTLQEGIDAVKLAMQLDPGDVRRYAMENYSLDAVGPMFDTWLARQTTSLQPDGWYTLAPDQLPIG